MKGGRNMKKTKSCNNEGSISYESARKKYRAAITDPQGNRIVKRFQTKQEAMEWLTITKAEIYQDTYIAPSTLTVGEWVLQYLKIYSQPNVKPKTMADYIHTASFLSAISDIPLQKCNTHHAQMFINALPPMASSTKLKVYRLLKAAVKKAYALHIIKDNFMSEVVGPSVEKKEIQVYSQEEIKKILDTVKDHQCFSRYFPLILTAFTTGMRLGEIIALRKHNVSNGYINVDTSIVYVKNVPYETTPKTKAGRRKIKIDAFTEATLRSVMTDKIISFDGFVFHTKNGTHFSQRNLTRMWKRVQEIAEVPHRNFHVIRHTHATQLIANGIPLPEVSKRLGHSKLSHTLNLYSHAIPEYDNKIADNIPAIFYSA